MGEIPSLAFILVSGAESAVLERVLHFHGRVEHKYCDLPSACPAAILPETRTRGNGVTEHVAALDGGGTKTQGAWATRGGAVGLTPRQKGCNPQDDATWAQELTAALRHFPPGTRAAVLGLPGWGEVPAHDRDMAEVARAALPEGELRLLNDVDLACHGALGAGQGVLVLAGTGSMAMAQGPLGRHRTGGWGDVFGDEGSAFWIGREALTRASMMRDGRLPDTGFAAALEARLGLGPQDGPFALSVWVARQTHLRPAIAALAREVDAMAAAGDPAALAVMEAAAEPLALLARTAARLAGLDAPRPWCVAGSVFSSPRVTDALARALGSAPAPARYDALGGGLLMAAEAAGWRMTADWAEKVAQGVAAAAGGQS
jgi:glucosamine kinase